MSSGLGEKKRKVTTNEKKEEKPDLQMMMDVKALPLVCFDPFKDKASVWIANFEREIKQISNLQNLEFQNVGHFLTGKARAWYVQSSSIGVLNVFM
jgi:hypothetical protein